MPTQVLTTSVLVIAVFIFAIGRQVLPRRPSRLMFLAMPILGLVEAYDSLPPHYVPAAQIAECLVSAAVSALAGYLQARVTRVYAGADGQVRMRGGWMYIGVWIALIALRLLILIAFNGALAGVSLQSSEWILWFDLAVVWGTRSALLFARYPEIRAQFASDRAARRSAR